MYVYDIFIFMSAVGICGNVFYVAAVVKNSGILALEC